MSNNDTHLNPAFDSEGFLKERQAWTPKIAHLIAERAGITLTEAHWELIHLIQAFYLEFGLSPNMRVLIKYAKKQLPEQKTNSIYFLSLFPGSPAKLLSKIAGLPKPDHCV